MAGLVFAVAADRKLAPWDRAAGVRTRRSRAGPSRAIPLHNATGFPMQDRPSLTVCGDGARFGSQTSYRFPDENAVSERHAADACPVDAHLRSEPLRSQPDYANRHGRLMSERTTPR